MIRVEKSKEEEILALSVLVCDAAYAINHNVQKGSESLCAISIKVSF